MVLPWLLLVGVMLLVLRLDLGLWRARGRTQTDADSFASLLMWITLAAGFAVGLGALYENNVFGLGLPSDGRAAIGAERAIVWFLAAYALELFLSLDSIVVMAAMFAHFQVPRTMQYRMLMVGAPLAWLVRAIMVFLGVWAIGAAGWVSYVFGAVILLSALRMVLVRQENMDPARSPIVGTIRRFIPISRRMDGTRLVTRVNGRRAATLLLVVLVLQETADAFFAVESIPASLAITREPLILVTAQFLAVMAQRAAFPLVVQFRGWIRYFKVALTLMLVLCAWAMIFEVHGAIPPTLMLGSILTLAAVGIGLSIVTGEFSRREPVSRVSPLGVEAEEIARLTLRQSRKLIVLIVGVTVVGLGIAMMIGPGPGIVVVPVGLAILATEFIWARRLLKSYARTARRVGNEAERQLVRRTRPWMIAPVVLGTVLVGVLLPVFTDISSKYVLMIGIPALVGQAVWAWTLLRARPGPKEDIAPQRAAPTEDDREAVTSAASGSDVGPS